MFGARVCSFTDPPCGCDHVALVLESTGFLITAFGAVEVGAVGLVASALGCLNFISIAGSGAAEDQIG